MPNAPLRLVIFDVDGTLIDSQAHILAAMRFAFDREKRPMPARDAILGIVGLSLPQAFARLVPDGDAALIDRLTDGYKDAFMTIRQDASIGSPLYPGARKQVETLMDRDDLLVGVATGKSRRGLDSVLKSLDWTGRFVTEQVADHHPSKPHPSMVLTALADTGTEAAHAVMIGDTTYDIEMARAAGVTALGVSWGYHPSAHLLDAGAAAVLDHFDDLPAMLAQLWEGR